jgi:hypothetical protein
VICACPSLISLPHCFLSPTIGALLRPVAWQFAQTALYVSSPPAMLIEPKKHKVRNRKYFIFLKSLKEGK